MVMGVVFLRGDIVGVGWLWPVVSVVPWDPHMFASQ